MHELELEPGKLRLITLSLKHVPATSLTFLFSFQICQSIFSSEFRCKRVLSPAKEQVQTGKPVGYQTSRVLKFMLGILCFM